MLMIHFRISDVFIEIKLSSSFELFFLFILAFFFNDGKHGFPKSRYFLL